MLWNQNKGEWSAKEKHQQNVPESYKIVIIFKDKEWKTKGTKDDRHFNNLNIQFGIDLHRFAMYEIDWLFCHSRSQKRMNMN